MNEHGLKNNKFINESLPVLMPLVLPSPSCWDIEFESRWGHGCMSIVNVACFQVEFFATGRSLVQGIPTDCGVSECHREAP